MKTDHLARSARLAELDDTEFGVRLLAATPTHENRDSALLHRWARTATEFGAAMAAEPLGPPEPPRVVERTGGLDPKRLLMARYTSRPATVELYTDTVAYAERLIDELGWRHWYPAGSVRRAALDHEVLHCRLHRGPERTALRHALDHTVLRAGRWRVRGHVAGAEELAAHGYAGALRGLGRTPLLLTAALAEALRPHPEKN